MRGIERRASSDPVVAVDGEQCGVECSVVQRVQHEDVLWVFGEVGMLTSWEDVIGSEWSPTASGVATADR